MHMRSVSMSINTANVWDLFTDCINFLKITFSKLAQICQSIVLNNQDIYWLYIVDIYWKYWTKIACNGQDSAGCSLQPAPIFNPGLSACGPTILSWSMMLYSVQKLCSSQFLNQAECSCLLLVIILSIFGVHVTCLPVVGLFNPEERKWKNKYSIILYFSNQNFRNLQMFNGLLKGWSFN